MTADAASGLTRRGLFAGFAAAGLGAAPQPFPNGVRLLVAGPDNGAVDAWAGWLAGPLARALSPGMTLRKDVVGGVDGVTAANQFDTRIEPDGATALLLPGSAAMAWLVGDPRAQFDAAHWVPALAAVTPAVVVSRVPANDIASGAAIRVAASSPAGPDLPALLALELMRAKWMPVFGLDQAAAFAAMNNGTVDVVCLGGRSVADGLRLLPDAAPLFSFGSIDPSGVRQRDPDFAAIPMAETLFRDSNPRLRAAWAATAAAAQLDMTLVLPQLTPASMVALWRLACAQVVPAIQPQAAAAGVRPVPPPAATAATSAVLADPAVLLALREWLGVRLNYRPA